MPESRTSLLLKKSMSIFEIEDHKANSCNICIHIVTKIFYFVCIMCMRVHTLVLWGLCGHEVTTLGFLSCLHGLQKSNGDLRLTR